MSNLKLFYQWWANLGKPEKNEQVTGLPLFFATLITIAHMVANSLPCLVSLCLFNRRVQGEL